MPVIQHRFPLDFRQHMHSFCIRRAGKYREQTGNAGGRKEGRFARCQCWELKNAKSFPYVKEILKSRQRFRLLFIDTKGREKGEVPEPGILFLLLSQIINLLKWLW